MYENEVEIDLIDLCIELLKHWRVIIVCILLGGILGAGFSYARSGGAASVEQIKTEEETPDVKELKESLTEGQLADVQAAYAYAEQIQYIKYSTVMNLDPNAVSTAKLILQLTPEKGEDGTEDLDGLSVALVELLSSPEYYQALTKEAKLKGDVRDLLQVSRTAGNANSLLKNLSVDGTNGIELSLLENAQSSYVIAVVLRGETEKVCEQLTESTLSYMEKKRPDLQKLYGAYKLTELSSTVATLSDTGILDRQTTLANNYKTMKANYDDFLSKFTEEQKAYYSYLDQNYMDTATENEEIESSGAARVSKKMVAIGLLLGAFLCLAVYGMLYIFDTHLKDSSDIEGMFRLSELGRVELEPSKKHRTAIDEKIHALKYRGKRRMSQKESVELIATAIGMLVSKKKLERIALAGMDLTAGADATCKSIAELVTNKNSNVDIRILNNIIYDAAAMEELKKVEAVVLVETAGSTLNTEIAKELEELSRHKVEVLGGVVVC